MGANSISNAIHMENNDDSHPVVIKNRKYVKDLRSKRNQSENTGLTKNWTLYNESERVEQLRDKLYKIEQELAREKTIKEAAVNKLYKLQKAENARAKLDSSTSAHRATTKSQSSTVSADSLDVLKRRHSYEERRSSVQVSETRRSSVNENQNRKNPKIIEKKYAQLKEAYVEMEANYKRELEALELKISTLQLHLEIKNEAEQKTGNDKIKISSL